METSNFIEHIRWLRNRLDYHRRLILNAEGIGPLGRQLSWTSYEMLHQLEIVEIAALSSHASARHSMPTRFYEMYDELVASMQEALGVATQQMLVREGRLRSVRMTEEDLDDCSSCRLCGGRFTEGMLVVVLSCSHRFHRNCIVGRYAVQARCPVCQSHI